MSSPDASLAPATESKSETPLLKKIIPVRGAARKAAQNLKEQNTGRPRTSTGGEANESGEESDAADVAEDEREETTDAPAKRKESGQNVPRKRGRPPGRGRGRGRGGASSGDVQRTPVQRRQSMRSLKAHETSLIAGSSPLTSPEYYETPPKRPQPSTSRSSSKRKKAAAPSRDADASGSFLDKCLASKPHENLGDFYTTGDLVWVRLNLRGEAIDHEKDVDSESYWWPAQVTGDNILRVDAKLFGDDGHGEDRLVNVSSMSQSTILSFRNEFGIRFSSGDFILSASPPDVDPFGAQTSTPAETPNLISHWKAAFDLALANDEDEELPDPLAVLTMTTSVNRKGKGKGKGKRAVDSEESISTPSPKRLRKSSPTPLDAEIKVGESDGELVLAREHKDRRDYWPARVVGVAQDKHGKWTYEVCFMDGKKKRIRRELFFSSDQDGFATCQLGTWNTKLAPSDTEGADTEDELRNRDAIRAPSPSPSESDLEEITDRESFGKLPLQDQMRYVYPFLCRIIRREYPPSFPRHDAFIRGGKSRGQLAQVASLRGEFSDNEMKKVSAQVRKAMLRSERWAERVFDGDNVRNEEESTTAHTSDGTKAESLAESTQSPVLDAAMALTELKSSEYNPPTVETALNTEHHATLEFQEVNSDEIIVDPPMPPPSSFVSTKEVDESSDMEMGSDDEDNSPTVEQPPPDSKRDDETLQSTAEIAVPPAPADPPSISLTVPQSPKNETAPETSAEQPSDSKVDEPPARRARPTGCADYENLPRSDRGMYCADVLLPEAVLQLHLLRAGRRTSAHVLPPAEEAKLYEEGQELLQTEVPWLTQIVQLRQVAERALKRNAKKKDTAAGFTVQGGTSSRPKVLKAKD